VSLFQVVILLFWLDIDSRLFWLGLCILLVGSSCSVVKISFRIVLSETTDRFIRHVSFLCLLVRLPKILVI
jgi:hypothetical protein